MITSFKKCSAVEITNIVEVLNLDDVIITTANQR